MTKIRIAEIILDLSSRAGAEVFFTNLCLKLKQFSDVELTVISLYDDVHPSFSEACSEAGIRILTLGKKKGADLSAAKRLKAALKDVCPDIIHTHRSILLTYFLAFGFRKKPWHIVHTIHSVPAKESNRVTNFLRRGYSRKKMISLVGISPLISSEAKALFPKTPIYTILNGINLPFLAKQASFDQRKYDFVCVARFSEVKNHQMLIRAFSKVVTEFPKARLLCVGDGVLLEESKKLTKSLGLDENVEFPGSTDKVYEALGQSKCFVLSSLYEGNPLSVLEAMHSGLCLLLPRVGGIPDIVQDLKNGFLYEPGNENALASLMIQTLANSAETEKIGSLNSTDVERFSMDECAKEYLNLFKDIHS